MISNMSDNDSSSMNSSTCIMIALYYVYVEIPAKSLDDHKEFHTTTCADLCLFGRIRISTEGINGVLSGDETDLKSYEEALKKEIEHRSPNYAAKRYGETLDMKYCHLRNDIPIETQTFEALSVKITQEVVSLGCHSPGQNVKHNARRKRGRKKNNKRHENSSQDNTVGKEIINDTMLEKKSESIRELCLDQFEPATHLTPQEWNEHLTLSSKRKLTSLDKSQTDHIQEDTTTAESDAIIIDARNVYESRIGHFAVDGVPTLLTNTRKYSSIPTVLNASIPDIAGKNVFMYCTGGVRCERASVYLQALAQSELWPNELPKPKQIYQLQGGIQKYLETYGTMETPDLKAEGTDRETPLDPESAVSITTPSEQQPCLYRGKNFVFDPRRHDPKVGPPGKSAGKCILCASPHDDYDHGCAPCENKETRCCRCRVLVLVCYGCRDNIRIWGEISEDDTNRTECDEGRGDLNRGEPLVKDKPKLFCGIDGKECIDGDNKVDHHEIIRS